MRKWPMLATFSLIATTASAEVFTWADWRGIRHYTNSIYEVPARYRQKVKVLDIATGKKFSPTAAQLAWQSQPAKPGDPPSGGSQPNAMPPANAAFSSAPSPTAPAYLAPTPAPPTPQASSPAAGSQRPMTARERRELRRRNRAGQVRGEEE
jgi:hypothetical protein